MKKTMLTFALLAATLSMVAACGQRAKTAENTEAAPVETVEASQTASPEAAQAEAPAADMAPDFTLPDLQGAPLKLSSLRGKYVIIDFWGSWCIWCIRGIPKMKEAYAKYKDQMEILGVDCNDTEAKWKAAVEQYQIPWLHVRCPDNQLQTIGTQYNIEGFPTKVVVDPEGRIAKVVVGEDPAFYTYLDGLFAKK